MGALSKVLRSVEGDGLAFLCPGCNTRHMVKIGAGPGPRWGYNGNAEKPTFTPSIKVTWHEPTEEGWAMMERGDPPPRGTNQYPGRDMVCHSFVRDGRIEFLGDCTHHLAGQTVDLPEMPE